MFLEVRIAPGIGVGVGLQLNLFYLSYSLSICSIASASLSADNGFFRRRRLHVFAFSLIALPVSPVRSITFFPFSLSRSARSNPLSPSGSLMSHMAMSPYAD